MSECKRCESHITEFNHYMAACWQKRHAKCACKKDGGYHETEYTVRLPQPESAGMR